MDSIQGKLDQFTNSLQTFWMDTIDSWMVKGILDLGKGILDLVDKIGLIPTALAGVLFYFTAIKKNNPLTLFNDMSAKIQNYGKAVQQIKAIQSLNGINGTPQMNTEQFNAQNINAYAAAVSNLTAKQQASALASAGLSQAQIQEAMAVNGVEQANIRQAISETNVATAKKQVTSITAAKAAAMAQEESVKISQEATNWLLAQGEAQLTVAKIQNAVASGDLTAAQGAEIISTFGLTAANNAASLSFTGLTASIRAMLASNPVGWIMMAIGAIMSLISWIGSLQTSNEELIQQADEIKNAYKQEADTIQNNISTLQGLQDEFNRLSVGVDDYGNNISLATDDYARYQEIVETIVGMSPSLISGYDAEGNALANKNGLLQKSIELMQEEQRIKAQEYLSKDNIKTITEGAVAGLKEDLEPITDTRNNTSILGTAVKILDDGTEKGGYGSRNIVAYLEDAIGVKFENQGIDQYIQENADLIKQNIGTILNNASKDFTDSNGNTWRAFSPTQVQDLEAYINGIISATDEASNKVRSMLQLVPQTKTGYYSLEETTKQFLNQYANNFSITEDTTEADVQAMQDKISAFTDFLISNPEVETTIKIGYNLNTGQDENGNLLSVSEYQKQVDEFKKKIQDSSYTDDQKNALLSMFGLDDDNAMNNEVEAAIEHIRNLLIKGSGPLTKEMQEYLDNLSVSDALYIKYKISAEPGSMSVDELKQKVADIKKQEGVNVIPAKTYSDLSESVDSFNEIQKQTSEIIADNTEVTQDYKDSLTELGLSEEELNECFYEGNPLVVKNADKLNELLKTSKKNVANNIKLAKSQAALKYYDLVKQLNSTLNGTNKLDNATRNSLNSTLQQINAVQQAIYKYQLLEDNLLGATNAFEKFAEAQEIDSMNTYGDSYVEMAQTMYDAFYKTGQVGTEANWAAIESLVPDSVYQGLKDDGDKMKAIYDYFNNNILPTLTLDEDKLSIEFDNIDDFVQKGIDSGVFEGNTEKFDLVEGMNLEKAADLMGMTTTQAYALFAELDKYNTSGTENSFLSQLDDSLEGRITNITSDIEELNKQKLALLEDGGYDAHKSEIDEINQKLAESQTELSKAGSDAYKMWQEYTTNDAALAALEAIEDKQRKLTESEAKQLGIEWDAGSEMTVQEAYDRLLGKQQELEKPTELTAKLAIENIDQQIAEAQGKLDAFKNANSAEEQRVALGLTAEADQASVDTAKQELETKIAGLKEDKAAIITTFDMEGETDVEDELNKIQEFTIGDKSFTVTANGTSTTLQSLKDINNFVIANKSYTVTKYEKTEKTSNVNGTANVRGTAFKNGSWGAPKTETALVGELGPEMLVRNGRWTTIGDNGAEFMQVQRGDIIFNHLQTKQLLENGYVTSRGKAYASGTAYSGLWRPTSPNSSSSSSSSRSSSSSDYSSSASDVADNMSDAADSANDFEETFDWVEVKLEEVNEQLDLMNAKLENAVGYSAKNTIIDQMLSTNKSKLGVLEKGVKLYKDYSDQLLYEIPSQYQSMAQNGAIAITEFAGEADEATVEAINNYRDWAQKVADLTQQMEELNKEISDLAKQKFDNVSDEYEDIISLIENQNEQLDDQVSLMEDRGYVAAKQYYEAMIKNTTQQSSQLEKEKKALQDVLDQQVKLGNVKKYSEDWYEMVNAIYEVDLSIKECTSDLESYQNAINDIYWDNFDELINRLDYLKDETQSLIDLMEDSDKLVLTPKDKEFWGEKDVKWTEEGIVSLGLYAQQMEIAEYQSKQYKKAIQDLNKDYQNGKYSETEYLEKLNDLKSAQYDAIGAYYDAQEAIKDLNETRVDSIKKGIEKEIDAYEKLIDKKKSELQAEKDLYDFQKSTMEQQKDIADIQRKLAALSTDNSASAVAKRKQLEADLAEAKSALEESYYDRSIDQRQEALDKELEDFQDEKNAEIEKWEEYLDQIELVIADSLSIIQDNASLVYDTLNEKAAEYNLNLSDAILTPWQDGALAVSDYQTVFDTAMSSTTDQLEAMKNKWQEVIDKMSEAASKEIQMQKKENDKVTAATYQKPKPATKPNNKTEEKTIKVGGKINAKGAKIYSWAGGTGSSQYFANDPIYTVLEEKNGYLKVRWHKASSGVTGWFKKSDVKAYKTGTKGVKEDQLAWIDENGFEELVLNAGPDGRLQYLSKGTSVLNSDLTERLMNLAMNPQEVLDRNRPQIGAPHITNNEINISMDIAEVVHIDKVTNDTLPDLTKVVEKQMDSYMAKINNSLKKFTR
jgi:hypothetical protein